METTTVPVRISDAITIRVEATHLGGPEKTGLETADFDEVVRAVEAVASRVSETLTRLKPQKATVEFGIEIGWETGKLIALLCQGEAKANLKIALEWSERPPKAGAQKLW